jgi:hypothetical protein
MTHHNQTKELTTWFLTLVCSNQHVNNLTNQKSLLVANVVLIVVLICLQLLYD